MSHRFLNPSHNEDKKIYKEKNSSWELPESPLHKAVRNKDISLLNELLTKRHMDPNIKNHNQLTPLHLVLCHNPLHVTQAVQLLLTHGANPNQQDHYGETPIHAAARHNQLECLHLCAKHHTLDLTLRNSHGETPLHTAVRSGHANMVHALLNYGAHADTWNHKGQTPRLLAKKNRELQAIFNSLAPETHKSASKTYESKNFKGLL